MKNTRFHLYSIYLLLVLAVFSCGQEDEGQEGQEPLTEEDRKWKEAQEEQEGPEMSLRERLDFYKDSITRYQTLAHESEEEKLHGAMLLIEEVEQSMSEYDASALDIIKTAQEEARDALYTDENLSDPDVMDNYDAKTKAMIDAIKAFKENNEEFGRHARAKLIYKDIIAADQQDMLLRTRYNVNVSDFNRVLRENEDSIDEMEYQDRKLKPYPFYWGEDPVVQ